VNLRAHRQVDVDADQRRREAAVFAAGDRDFGVNGCARAEEVAGVREAGDRHRTAPHGDRRETQRDRRERQRREGKHDAERRFGHERNHPHTTRPR
jgi:hypothetical protein